VQSLENGKILIAGDFTEIKDGSFWSAPQRGHVARFDANGALDDTFNPPRGADNMVEDMALQSDGKILIAGWFKNYDAVFYPYPTNAVRVARLNSTGELDATFSSNSGPDNTAYSVLWLSNNRAIVSGDFINYRGVARPGIARIVATSTLSPPTGFAAWVKANFQPKDPPAGQAATADPDHDGIVNILEYAFGLNPKVPDRTGLPYAGFVRTDQIYGRLTYLRPKTAPADLIYEWQASTDLLNWQPANVIAEGETAAQGDCTAVMVRTQAPINSTTTGFYRLQVKPIER
jgi:hypothetical protein